MEAIKDEITNNEESTFSLEIVAELGELGAGAIISESALAKLLRRHQASVKRAVARGELPQPVRLLGQPVWTVGVIVKFLEKRLADAAREEENMRARIKSCGP